ncbi:hypothetical protein EJ02DRAFT_353707 [Clathrospora elynae]|uniref:Uncharacterized protein n=1 Tax=Clathrospora elynae TaxID=706981 RepID=A0A6A5SHG7_9PLEO|nr:hypothetical protein EJ02DRAFT_353707 [Clathrospora elynae]
MLSLPLAKLSWAQDTDPNEQKFGWQHETHDLTFVLDSYGARASSQLLKVVQGTQVRHLIELERLISEGDEMARLMQERGVQMQAEQLPMSAIVRCPLLAIRWQLPNKKVRRAQLKFKSSEDFDVAYKHLHQLGLRMSSSKEAQAQSRSATPSPERVPSHRPTLTAIAHPEQSTRGSLSCPPSRLAEISSRPYTAVDAPTFPESHLQEAAHVRPMSAAAGHHREEHSTSSAFPDPLAPPIYFARPSSATSDVLGHTPNSMNFSSHDRFIPTIEEVPRASSERPETAMLFNRPDTAEALPPRRELPFQRLSEPLSSGSDSARPPSRPSTGLMGPPPLPARVINLRPSSSRGAIQETELPPLPQPTVIGKTPLQMQAIQQPPRTPNQDQNTPQRTGTSPYEDIENRPLSSSSPASSPLSLKRSCSTALPTSRPLKTLSNAAQNLRRTMSQNAPATPPTSEATFQDPSSSGIGPTVRRNDNDSLAAYAMQSEEGRRAALNEFVFRHLESDDFLTLVEDMETCWARAALGMQ